jgi:hypothetical protein
MTSFVSDSSFSYGNLPKLISTFSPVIRAKTSSDGSFALLFSTALMNSLLISAFSVSTACVSCSVFGTRKSVGPAGP